jgi:hypothetical protein
MDARIKSGHDGIRFLEARFERLKSPFQLPLLRCFRVRREEGHAWRRRLALARRLASALVQNSRAAGMSSAKPLVRSSWRSPSKSSRHATSLVMVLSRFQVGVAINSRYCVFWFAARLATSSSHSPVWLGSVPPNFVNAPKKWSWPCRLRKR